MKKLAKRLLAALLALTLLSATLPAAMAVNDTCGTDCTVSGCTCGTAHTGTTCDCAACSAFQSITADVFTVTLRPTETKFLAITASYPTCSGKANEAVSSGLTYASSNNTVATVDTAGRITGVADGVADITVRLNDTVQCHVIVTVASAPTLTVAVSASKTAYTAGETLNLTATAGGGYGAGTYTYQWKKDGTYLSGQTSSSLILFPVMTTDSGSYTCEVRSTKDNSVLTQVSHTLTITVTEPAYTISLTPVSGLSLKAGDYGYVYATIKQGANVYKTATAVTFTSTSSSVATVSSSANTSTSNGTATATVSALKKGSTSIYATVTIGGQTYTSNSVSVSVTSSYSMDTINYESDSDGYATFDGYDFYKEFKDVTGKTLSYVNFTSQYGGQLYKDADSTSNSNKVTSSTDCYYNPSSSSRVDLDKVTFIVDSDKKSHYAEFTAYGSGVTVTGKVTIDDNGTVSGDIVYYVSSEDTVSLDEDDFQDFFEDEYTNGTLDYVKFVIGDATNYGSSTYGYLYETDDAKADKVSSGTKYCYEASSTQDDLDDVVFTAGTRTSSYTVKIPFTATGKYKSTTKSVDGTLVIEVNSAIAITVPANGASFGDLGLVEKLTPRNVSSSKLSTYYIQFEKVTGGTLYSYYNTAADSEQWSRRDKFYFSGINGYALSGAYFIPKSNTKTAEISYTLYQETSNGKSYTEKDSGKITLSVSGMESSDITLEADQDGYVVFNSDEFRKAIQEATGATPTTVKFTAQQGGTLYQNADSTAPDNELTLGGKVYCYKTEDLTRIDLFGDDFGRPGTVWKLGKEELGVDVEPPIKAYTTAVTSSDILRDCALADGTAVDVYTNGVKGAAQLTLQSENPVTIGGQGTLTQVYKDRIIVIDTFLARVTKVVKEKKDAAGHLIRTSETTLQVWDTVPETRFAAPDTTHTYTFESEEFAEDDMVLVTIAGGRIQSVELADSRLAEFSKIKKADSEYAQIALDDTYSNIAAKYIYNGIDPAKLGSDMIAYFDTYGNVIGMERYYTPLEMAVVDALWIESVKGKATIKADLVTVDGVPLEDVTIDSLTLYDGIAYTASTIVANAGSSWSTASDYANSAYVKEHFYDKLMSYTVDADGVYTLSMEAITPLEDATFTNGSAYAKVGNAIQLQMTDETSILTRGADTAAPYATYTGSMGYDSVPTVTAKAWYHIDNNTNKAGAVYIYDVSAAGTETVIFYAGADVSPIKKDSGGKYTLEFRAYALDKSTGRLTEGTYTYVSTDRTVLDSLESGFYDVHVKETNEILFDSATYERLSDPEIVTDKVGDAVKVGDTLIEDAETYKWQTDCGSALENSDFSEITKGATLYIYRDTANCLYTIVDAWTLASVTFTGISNTSACYITDAYVGHPWKALQVKLPEGAEVVKVENGSTDITAMYASDDDTITTDSAITVTVRWANGYAGATLINGATVGKAAYATIGTDNITLKNGIRVSVNQLIADLEEQLDTDSARANVTVYSALGVKAASDDILECNGSAGDNYAAWYVKITSFNGELQTMYWFTSDTATYSAPMELQGIALQSVETERQMLDGVCFRLADGVEEGSVSYTAYDVSGAPIAMGRIVIKPAAAPPTVSVGSARVKAGKTVQIPLKLENNPGFADLSVEIEWDGDVMALESVEPTAFGGILTTSQTVQNDPYLLNWTSTQDLTYNGTLALLNFSVREDAPEGEYPVTVRYYRGRDGANRDGEDVNYDENHTAVPFAYESGTVTVLHYTPGDTTGDDKVTSRDAVYILQYLAGWDVEGLVPAAMDVDGNGRVNSWDAILLLRYIAGWDVELH